MSFKEKLKNFINKYYYNKDETDILLNNKVSIEDIKENVFYGTCNTAPYEETKSVIVDNWSFETGNILFVKFNQENTRSQINILINGVTKNVRYRGSNIIEHSWQQNELVYFVYDGTNMVMLKETIANQFRYGLVKTENEYSSSTADYTKQTVATSYALNSVYNLIGNKANSTHNHVYSDLTNVSTVAVVVTYTDDSTETLNLLKYPPPSS